MGELLLLAIFLLAAVPLWWLARRKALEPSAEYCAARAHLWSATAALFLDDDSSTVDELATKIEESGLTRDQLSHSYWWEVAPTYGPGLLSGAPEWGGPLPDDAAREIGTYLGQPSFFRFVLGVAAGLLVYLRWKRACRLARRSR